MLKFLDLGVSIIERYIILLDERMTRTECIGRSEQHPQGTKGHILGANPFILLTGPRVGILDKAWSWGRDMKLKLGYGWLLPVARFGVSGAICRGWPGALPGFSGFSELGISIIEDLLVCEWRITRTESIGRKEQQTLEMNEHILGTRLFILINKAKAWLPWWDFFNFGGPGNFVSFLKIGARIIKGHTII